MFLETRHFNGVVVHNNSSPTQKDLFAYPLNEQDFPEISNIVDAFTAFVAYNNIN